jgi:putative ABC transport system permease protein
LAQAARVSGVTQVTPLLFAGAKWQEPLGGPRLDAFIIGLDPPAHPFAVTDIERQESVLAQSDTMLVDDATRPIFGPLTAGAVVLLNNHRITIGGDYRLGTGFLGIGVAVVNEANFLRLFAPRPAEFVNLGLITLAPDREPSEAAVDLANALPDDVQIFTRGTLQQHEDAYWTTRTSVGLIFGSGLIVAFIVGIVVLYQTLATQIARHLPEFATLKAMGYTDGYLVAVVTFESTLIVLLAFLPALAAALTIYPQIRRATLLPVSLRPTEFLAVLTLTILMSVISAFLSLGNLRRADPADVF